MVEKTEQAEMRTRKCDATKWIDRSCCGLRHCDVELHFWGDVRQATV